MATNTVATPAPSMPDERQIEVTPEMIEAGADVVSDFFDEILGYGEVLAFGPASSREVAERVYRIMESIRRGALKADL